MKRKHKKTKQQKSSYLGKEKMATVAKCFTCMFFERTDQTCRANPPAVWAVPGHLEQHQGQHEASFVDSKSGFPPVDPSWWCARYMEFAPDIEKKPKEGESKPEQVQVVQMPTFGGGAGPQKLPPSMKIVQAQPQQKEEEEPRSDEQSGDGNEY